MDTIIFRGVLRRVDTSIVSAKEDLRAVARVRNDSLALSIVREYGDFDDPTTVNVTVERSPIGGDTAWRAIARPRFNFGGRRRFAIGVGFAFTWFETSDYQAVKRLQPAPAGAPGDTVINTIVLTQHTEHQITPVLTLTARLSTLPWHILDGFHTVVAAGPRSEEGKLAFDYFFGLGLSGFDERIVLSAGLASGKERRLAKGFSVDGRLPADQEDVPVRTSRSTEFAAMLSFRVY